MARRRTFWQACTQFYPNCDDVPLVCGVRYALLSVGFLGQMANPLHYKLPFAVYSVALDLAVEARYWDPAVIPEDWHMFLRCFYATAGEIRVEPLPKRGAPTLAGVPLERAAKALPGEGSLHALPTLRRRLTVL